MGTPRVHGGVLCVFLVGIILISEAASIRRQFDLMSTEMERGSSLRIPLNSSHHRREWCKTKPLRVKVHHYGCRPTEILNHFCYGHCKSVYIPYYGSVATAFETCSVCTPVHSYWKLVTLKCPNQAVKLQRERVHFIKKCRCITVRLKGVND